MFDEFKKNTFGRIKSFIIGNIGCILGKHKFYEVKFGDCIRSIGYFERSFLA